MDGKEETIQSYFDVVFQGSDLKSYRLPHLQGEKIKDVKKCTMTNELPSFCYWNSGARHCHKADQYCIKQIAFQSKTATRVRVLLLRNINKKPSFFKK